MRVDCGFRSNIEDLLHMDPAEAALVKLLDANIGQGKVILVGRVLKGLSRKPPWAAEQSRIRVGSRAILAQQFCRSSQFFISLARQVKPAINLRELPMGLRIARVK